MKANAYKGKGNTSKSREYAPTKEEMQIVKLLQDKFNFKTYVGYLFQNIDLTLCISTISIDDMIATRYDCKSETENYQLLVKFAKNNFEKWWYGTSGFYVNYIDVINLLKK